MPDDPQEISPYKDKKGLPRLVAAFGHSLHGIAAAIRHEDAFRVEVVTAAIAIPAAFFVAPDAIGRALLVGSVLLVLIVELLNSAVEAVVDRISLERHPLAGRAKDLGSAAVLVALANAAAVWGLVVLGR